MDRFGEPEIADFLTELALTGHVVAGTQNQAISSLTLFYEKVLGRDLGFINSLRAKESLYLPVVLTKSEVISLLAGFPWDFKRTMFLLMYGSGLRHRECRTLRIKDVKTTEIYTHVMNRPGLAVTSPSDRLALVST